VGLHVSEPEKESALRRFWDELRRRGVIRAAVVYALVGWVVIEVASTVLPPLNLPDWSVKLVIVLVALGFPIAVIMGWVFDVGPRGLTRTAPATAATEHPASTAATPAASMFLAGQLRQSRATLYQRLGGQSIGFPGAVVPAQAYASLGRKHDEMKVRLGALNTIERHLRLNPHDTRALYCGAQNLWRVGEHAKALELAERALRQDQNEPLVLYNVACFYVEQGDRERAVDLLEKAVEMGWGDLAWMKNDSDLYPLHDNERFKALLARIN